jgi:nicotinamidase/pyrazinamidase
MAGTVFWDVDTQVDFMKADGKLYVPEAESIIGNLKRLTEHAHRNGIPIVASADDHEPGHRELSATPDFRETFPLHCMRGTPGQGKIPETALKNPLVIEPEAQDPGRLAERIRGHRGDFLLNKHWFDVFTNENADTLIETLAPESIVLYGVALDVCNRYAIEGIVERHPHVRLFAVTDAMKPIDHERAEHLFKEWGEEGVRLVTTDEVIEENVLAESDHP